MLPEVRMSRIEDAIGLHRGKKLSCAEAADFLGCSERHFLWLRIAYGEWGAAEVIDRRRGRASGRRAEIEEIEFVVGEYRERYFDFRPKHFPKRLRASRCRTASRSAAATRGRRACCNGVGW